MVEPYYEEPNIKIYCRDALEVMKDLPENSIDLIVTDPPYGYSFMGKDWDTFEPKGAYQYKKGFKKLPRNKTTGMTDFFIPVWKECLRILKAGAFAFVMCAPRQDVLCKQIIALTEAGFNMGFTSIYWAYASGFPKAENIGKSIDKKECRKQLRKRLGRIPTKKEFEKEWERFAPTKEIRTDGTSPTGFQPSKGWHDHNMQQEYEVKKRVSIQAKALNGSYGGFQPKPAVEVIIVAMKPLSEKTYVDQALKNKKGIAWLDDCKMPYESKDSIITKNPHTKSKGSEAYQNVCYGKYNPTEKPIDYTQQQGRFPANLLVSDDVLNDGKGHKVGKPQGGYGRMGIGIGKPSEHQPYTYKGKNYKVKGFVSDCKPQAPSNYADSGSFSRYFDLDKWAQKTFPFLIVPKASKSEKNKGCENMPEVEMAHSTSMKCSKCGLPILSGTGQETCKCIAKKEVRHKMKNYHPTVKPIKLMSYLIILGSREGDVVLDPFVGSGTTLLSSKLLNRRGIGIDNKQEYCDIAVARLKGER